MFPLYDDNPTQNFPIATLGLMVLCVLSWVLYQGMGQDFALANSMCTLGLIPGDLTGSAVGGTRIGLADGVVCVLSESWPWYTLITHMFLHGSWAHLIGNVWFLWVFGDNIEDALGPFRFVVFYLLCGIVAASAQILSGPESLIPMVGASGAIGGVMGAYARLHPHARVKTFLFLGFFFTFLSVPALFMLGYWFVLQILGGLASYGAQAGGVAFFAHLGGFLAGLVLVPLFMRSQVRSAR